jgi:hypothetical protein
MSRNFVSDDFQVPALLENERVRLRMLSINDVVKDYDAVMTSIDHLRGVFGPESRWPSKDLTLEQDLVDLGWHQKEFQKRTSFAYTVVRPDESECVGCVYIYPSPNRVHDSMVIFWVRQSEVNNGLDDFLCETVKNWVREKWPFKNPGYPGRDIGWAEWNALK